MHESKPRDLPPELNIVSLHKADVVLPNFYSQSGQGLLAILDYFPGRRQLQKLSKKPLILIVRMFGGNMIGESVPSRLGETTYSLIYLSLEVDLSLSINKQPCHVNFAFLSC